MSSSTIPTFGGSSTIFRLMYQAHSIPQHERNPIAITNKARLKITGAI